MAIPRDEAFAVFEDLLAEGLRPMLHGFRSQDDRVSYWPKGSEGFFVWTHFSPTTQLGALIEDFQRFQEIAERHGLVAWFSGAESEDRPDGAYAGPYRITFERPRGRTYSGAQNTDSENPA